MKFIIIALSCLIVIASTASSDFHNWSDLSNEQRTCFVKAFAKSSDGEKVSISATFYEQIFSTKVFCAAFFLFTVWLCNFLAK